jgi:hypothetical protein
MPKGVTAWESWIFFVASVLVLMGLNASWVPDFLITGAQKSGTTALFAYLNQHFLTRNAPGEAHYFYLQFKLKSGY